MEVPSYDQTCPASLKTLLLHGSSAIGECVWLCLMSLWSGCCLTDWDVVVKQEPLREAALRSVSAIVYTKEEQELKEIGIASTMDVITRKTRPLIGDMRSSEDELRSLLQDAVDIWSLTQRSPQRIIALLNDKTSADSPAFNIDEGISMTPESSEGRPRASILTFPTVLVANTLKILHSGYALRVSNPLIFLRNY